MQSGEKRPATSRGDASRRKPSQRTSSNVVTSTDYEELKKHYKFVLPESATNEGSSWQDRMVENYHSHLYKEFAIVDLSVPGRIGLRFRTKAEVVSGKGFQTCANKHCPSYQHPEEYSKEARNRHLANQQEESSGVGEGLCDYEVPFQYVEENESKMELVKLRLCRKCAPLLKERSGSAKRASNGGKNRYAEADDSASSSSSSDSSSCSEDSYRKRKSTRRQRKKKSSKGRDENGETPLKSQPRSSSQKEEQENGGSDRNDDSSERSRRRHRKRKETHKHRRKHKKSKRRK